MRPYESGDRPSGALEWRTTGGLEGRYDRASGRWSSPLGVSGLGIVAAAEATLDDAGMPQLRSLGRRKVLGGSLGWRADNRMLGYLKLVQTGRPSRSSLQLLASRIVTLPYDPMWTADGWWVPGEEMTLWTFSPESTAGSVRSERRTTRR